jgi:hypothetical protein
LSSYPLHPLLPPPPITTSTQSPQSSAAVLSLSIAAAVDVHRACHHHPPLLPSNANARYCHPLLPLSNTIFADVTRHQTSSNSVAAIKHPCSLLPLSITTIKCCC